MINYPREKLVLFGTFIIVFILLVSIISISFIDTKLSTSLTSMVFTNIIIGRVPSISLGTSLDLNMLYIVGINFFTEAILTLFFYTLFLYSLKNIQLLKPLSNRVTLLQNTAIKYKAQIDKYGMFGLLVFVFFPFWMTGPVVGIIVGHLMNFSLIKNITIVFTGTIFALFCWTILIKYFIEYIQFLF